MARHTLTPNDVRSLQMDVAKVDAFCAGPSENGNKRLSIDIWFLPQQPPSVFFTITNRPTGGSSDRHVQTLPAGTTLEQAIEAYNDL
jgi:hypothetical protein